MLNIWLRKEKLVQALRIKNRKKKTNQRKIKIMYNRIREKKIEEICEYMKDRKTILNEKKMEK